MKKIAKKIKRTDNIAIFVHENPDGDAIGSIVALSTALINMGKNVEGFVERVPDNMTFLFENVNWIKTYDSIDFTKKYDLCISLDCGEKERMGKGEEVFNNAEFTISLDHHKTNIGFGNLQFSNSKAAATGEIIYDLLELMKIKMTPEIARAIYVAIVCDTGMFKHQNTTPKTFKVASKLATLSINMSDITHKLFNESSFARVKCLGEILNTLEVYLDGKVGILYSTLEMVRKYELDETELDGIVDFARNIKGVDIGIFIKQKCDNEYKVSLRANTDTDMSVVAGAFGGGGHRGAAGCKFETDSIDEIKNKLLDEILKELK